MNRRSLSTGAALAGAAFLVTGLAALPANAKPGKKQVLFFTKSAGFEHGVIKTKDGQPSFAEKALKELGEKNGFEVTHTKDGSVFTKEGMAKYDAFVFFTTGDLTQAGSDKNPPMPDKQLFLDTIKAGKGFVGLHAASDTFHSGPDFFKDDGDAADPYIKMLGGEFIRHGEQQAAKVFCVDQKFPGFADCKAPFEMMEEWYALKNISKDAHVLAWIATWSMKNTGGNSVYRRAPYPVVWAKNWGKGRVFYTAMGHREDVWENPTFQSTLVGGIEWASGAKNATIKPNVLQVTPGFNDPSPQDPQPEKKKAAAAPEAAPGAPAKAAAPGAATTPANVAPPAPKKP